MNRHLPVLTVSAIAALSSLPTAGAASLAFGIGIRETGSNVAIGANGGSTGGIEFLDRGVHVVPNNYQWQTITINFATATIAGFAGATADGTLSAANNQGVLEQIAIDVVDSAGPFQLYLDNLIYTDANGLPAVIADWEGFPDGSEVVFQEPGFSGSTSGNIDVATDSAGSVTGGAGNGSDGAYEVNFTFLDANAGRWVRLTTSGAPNIPNPAVGLTGTLSFDVRIVPEPASLGLFALSGMAFLRRRR